MQVSAHITPDDHRDVIATMANMTKVRCIVFFTKFLIFSVAVLIIVALARFVWALGVVLHRGVFIEVFGILSQSPYLLPMFLAALIMVPVAVLLLRFLNQQRQNLNSIVRKGLVNEAFLRDGVNIGETRYELDDDGIRMSQTFVQEFYAWDAFQRIEESEHSIFLVIDDESAIFVPKRAFSDGDGHQSLKAFIEPRIWTGR